jgi:hypothetical protein
MIKPQTTTARECMNEINTNNEKLEKGSPKYPMYYLFVFWQIVLLASLWGFAILGFAVWANEGKVWTEAVSDQMFYLSMVTGTGISFVLNLHRLPLPKIFYRQ